MNDVSPFELLDQIKHALRLCEIRLEKLNDKREPGMREILNAELKAREYTLTNRNQANEFKGVNKVWWEYIMNKAYITALWDRRQMSDEEFHEKATALRQRRDSELSRGQNG